MNCQEFEKAINDLARDRMLEATQRARGLAHAEVCARCAARLAHERALTLGLHSLASSMQQAEAPARIETALVAAFRERDQWARLEPAARPAARAVRSRWRSVTGIAAGLALLFVALAASRIEPQQPSQQQAAAIARDSRLLRLGPWPALEDEGTPRPAPAALTTARGPQSQLPYQSVAYRTRNSMNGSNRGEDSIGSAQTASLLANSTTSDIATDYIPLTYAADLNVESGRVVRVELPRSALTRFGLPVNAERAGEPVQADVLLGDDGLARAIRFVR
ncbi:MAG TPA: hypothetical protein VF553_02845 [Pyrinomonadaceae bacterium]|jgi:hypothetical protein